MIVALRIVWLAWATRLCFDAALRMHAAKGDKYEAMVTKIAMDDFAMGALAACVVLLSFGTAKAWRWALLALSSTWSLYFSASFLIGDEGPFFPVRLVPLIGLAVSVLTVRWTWQKLRQHR